MFIHGHYKSIVKYVKNSMQTQETRKSHGNTSQPVLQIIVRSLCEAREMNPKGSVHQSTCFISKIIMKLGAGEHTEIKGQIMASKVVFWAITPHSSERT
jgi:hypothetical protein